MLVFRAFYSLGGRISRFRIHALGVSRFGISSLRACGPLQVLQVLIQS